MKKEEKSVLQWQQEMQFLEDYLEIYMVKSELKPIKNLFLEDCFSECLEEIDCDTRYENSARDKVYESVCSQR